MSGITQRGATTGTAARHDVGPVAVITIDNPPVNALSADVRRALLRLLHEVQEDDTVEGVVLEGAGQTFVAGSDLREFDGPIPTPTLPEVLAVLTALRVPVVAAVHGWALGGGFELALACDRRVASVDALVGLPEVTLGIIPGAGGTQRLPRLIGLPAAIELIASGERITAARALQLGALDAVVEDDPRAAAVELAQALAGDVPDRSMAPAAVGDPDELEAVERHVLHEGKHRPAVRAAIEAARWAIDVPFDAALQRERQTFDRLRVSAEAAALRHLFFAERAVQSNARALARTAPPVRRVGVVGAGTMGRQITAALLEGGLDVDLVDSDPVALERATAWLDQRARHRPGERANLSVGTELDRLDAADIVIEAVFEDLAVKQATFAVLDRLGSRPVLASNTSYLDLDDLAAVTWRPADVVGLHFFAPAHATRLAEVVRASHTDANALGAAVAVTSALGKIGVVVGNAEGFVGNRIFAAYRRHCEILLEEGAFPEDIDAALTAFGFAMGPFAVADMSGLDIAWRMRQRRAAARDPRERYVPIADWLCESGRLGQKSGRGWYRYEDGSRTPRPDPEVRALVEAASVERGITRRTVGADEIVDRLLAVLANESALVLAESVSARPGDIDLILVNGYGFPRHEGGPTHWATRPAQRARLDHVVDEVVELTGFDARRGDLQLLEGAR